MERSNNNNNNNNDNNNKEIEIDIIGNKSSKFYLTTNSIPISITI